MQKIRDFINKNALSMLIVALAMFAMSFQIANGQITLWFLDGTTLKPVDSSWGVELGDLTVTGTCSGCGGGGGSAVILDLGDDDSNESADLVEIATDNDTNSIFTEPSANKFLIDAGNNWPTADTANAGDSATAFFSAGTIEHERGGLEADVSAYTGLLGVTGGSTEEIDTYSEINSYITDVTLTHNGLFDTFSELDSIVADESLLNIANDFAITGDYDIGSGVLQIPNSITLPATCEVGDVYFDTDATSGQRIYACESTNTWALQGDGGGGGGSPGGSDTQVQYNNGGAFGGDSDFVWDDVNHTLTLGTTTATARFKLPSSNDAVTPTLDFGGGDGIYHDGSNLVIAGGGLQNWNFGENSFRSNLGAFSWTIANAAPSITSPTYRFDVNTGIGGSNDQVAVIAGGVQSMLFTETGGVTTISSSEVIDFGVADSFEVPNGTGNTIDADGEIAHDTSADQLVYGADADVIDPRRWPSITIESPDDADNFLIGKLPFGITITDVHCIVDPADSSESVVIDIQERNSTGDSPASFDSTITCDNDGAEDDGTLSNATFDSGDWWSIDIGTVTGTVTQVSVSIYYQVVRE